MNAPLFLPMLMVVAPNPGLREMIQADQVTGLDTKASSSLEQWSTSFVGERFGAHALRDGRTTTAWCEGVPGDGVGEIVIGPAINPLGAAEIWVGNGKSTSAFKEFGRPHRVRVYLLGASRYDYSVDSETGGEVFERLRVRAKHDVLLEDVDRYQELALPALSADDARGFGVEDARVFVAIEILDVTRGTRDDTCITEIRQSLRPEERQNAQVLRWPTAWPAVLPCAPLYLLSSTTPSTTLAEWHGSGDSLNIGAKTSFVPVGPVEPTFNSIELTTVPGGEEPNLTWRVDCGRKESLGSVAWTCKRPAGCTTVATYPLPSDYKPALQPCAKLQVCDGLADLATADGASVANSTFAAALTAYAKALAREMGAAARLVVGGHSGSSALAKVAASAEQLARAGTWKMLQIKPAPGEGSDKGAGGIAVFAVAKTADAVSLACAHDPASDAHAVLCELSFEIGKTNVQYSGDARRKQQYLQYGQSLVLLDVGRRLLSLSGGALRLR